MVRLRRWAGAAATAAMVGVFWLAGAVGLAITLVDDVRYVLAPLMP